MRKFFLFLMAISVSLAMVAGDKLSAPAKMFLQQRTAGVAQNPDGKNALSAPKSINGVEFVDCFISLNGSSTADIEALGAKVTGKFSDFILASIPINKLEAVAMLKGVKQVGIARNARLLTDVAKGVTNADKAPTMACPRAMRAKVLLWVSSTMVSSSTTALSSTTTATPA